MREHRAGFDIDLRLGESREHAFENVLRRAKVEVKFDVKARDTGNVCIEFEQQGRPSGIATSTADYWAIEFFDDCYIILPTDRLRDIARQVARQNKNNIKNTGDNGNRSVLVPIQRLLSMQYFGKKVV